MKLFERFDKVFCINLKRRPDRFEQFKEEVDKFDLGNFETFEAIDGNTIAQNNLGVLKPSEKGLIESNIKILKNCIEKKYSSVLIIEDDCLFTDEINKIDSYFDCLPNDWEMLYMGGNHNTHIKINPPEIINEKVYKLHSTYSTHFVAIKNVIFEYVLNELQNNQLPLDVTYTKIQKNKRVYCFYPAIAKQRNGYSDIQHSFVDYDWLIK